MAEAPELILASGSSARRQMLQAAGVTFRVVPADVDEDAIRAALTASGPDCEPEDVVAVLARAKAEEVSRRYPAALVIGADQVLALDGEIFTKAPDLSAAQHALRKLAGKTHLLHSAVSMAVAGAQEWEHLDTAALSMRNFSEAFLDRYLATAGESVCLSVGSYQLEGLGIQLFEQIEGDYFTILGMPLLPVLHELRMRGVIPA